LKATRNSTSNEQEREHFCPVAIGYVSRVLIDVAEAASSAGTHGSRAFRERCDHIGARAFDYPLRGALALQLVGRSSRDRNRPR
jgi:hypothetical protein